METLLRRVKSKLSIRAHRAIFGVVEGEYRSLFHGRSMDFDDLRPYIAGDDIRDIDWKATARHGAPLTKRFIASRRHTVVLIVDTGRDMAALAASGEPKRDLVILAAGTAGYLAVRQGDAVALVAGTSDTVDYVAPEATESHLERILQRIHSSTRLDGAVGSVAQQLDYVARTFRRRMIVVVIGDDRVLSATEQRLARRLSLQHDMLWLSIGDADVMQSDWALREMYDVGDASPIVSFIRRDQRLRQEFMTSVAKASVQSQELFRRLRISSGRVTSEADVVPGLFRLLEAHKHARR
ncbi:MAG: DUF58 domain-containing protein [Rhodoglobus sp.]